MRRPGWMLVLAVSLLPVLAACGSSPGESAASCAAPSLNDQPPGQDVQPTGEHGLPTPTVAPGDILKVYGHWYTSTCNDTGGHDPLKPLPPVRLTLALPGGSVVPIGRFTPAGAEMGFTAALRVPVGTPTGNATISDDEEHPATYTFAVVSD